MKEKKKHSTYKVIMLLFITIVFTAVITTVGVYNVLSNGNGVQMVALTEEDSQIIKAITKFRKLVQDEYLGKVDEQKLIDGAIKGYIDALGDPYSEYYTASEMQEEMESVNGEYVGIGVYIGANSKTKEIVMWPMNGSVAEQAGVQNGDVLKKIGDVSYNADTMEEAIKVIKEGKEGEKITLVVERDGKEITIEVERRKVEIKHVAFNVLENKIGYIQISSFEGNCVDEFEDAYTTLKEEGITSLVIDVRDNGGGVVDYAIDIADLLLDKDRTIFKLSDKEGNEEEIKTKKTKKIDVPMVLLVNENSASASEILAGALQDQKRATLVGTRTYGKGVMQTLHKLSDGTGIKLTTNEYCTPLGNKINGQGIQPDVEVALPSATTGEGAVQDTQLLKAVEILKTKE